MSTDVIAVVVALAAAAGAGIAWCICISKLRQAQAVFSNERDNAKQTIRERDATIADLTKKGDTLQQSVTALESEKGVLTGRLTVIDSLKSEIAEKAGQLEEQAARIVTLEASNARLEESANAAEASKRETIEAQEQAFRQRMIEKEKSLEDVLKEKDRAIEGQKQLLTETEKVLTEKFSDLSVKSLVTASEQFLNLANERFEKSGEISKAELEKRQQAIAELLKPVSETLDKLEKQHQSMEERRVSAFTTIEKSIETLSGEADQLANALRKPTSRGAWGEMNLHVILENAGLVQGEHFDLQDVTSDTEDGRARTDVLIHLPQGRHLVIDSKAPLESFWDGMNATEEALRKQKFDAHARLVRDHVKKLSHKSYWARYEASPDFTIMFVPTEGAYQAAIEADPTLIAEAQKSRVYITSPMNLIGMIHCIAYVLREERLAQNAQQVQETACELYKRVARFIEHIEKLGRNLRLTVDNFNGAVGSLDGRVLPIARKMNSLGIGGGADLEDIAQVDAVPRNVLSQDHLLIPLDPVISSSHGQLADVEQSSAI